MKKGTLAKKAYTLSIISLALVVVAVVGSTPAWAISFGLVGLNDPTLKAEVDFTYTPDTTTGTINVGIKNTSTVPVTEDPRFTAFAFNAPGQVTGLSSFTGPSGWNGLFSPNNINTPGPFGCFDIAAITGPNFNGGDANDGIPVGSTFNFQFVLAGTDMNTLSASSFLSLSSFLKNDNEVAHNFFGRWQRTGPDGEGSDVAVVPIPGTVLLFGSGLLGLVGFRKKINRA